MIKISKAVFQDTGKSALIIEAPYHPDFPAGARRLGGSWSALRRHWTFDARDEIDIRALLIEVYGTDGSAGIPTVDVEVSLDGLLIGDELWMLGRQLVSCRSGFVRLGDGVRILIGELYSGSRRDPHLTWQENTTLLVRDVPTSLLDKLPDKLRPHVRIHDGLPSSQPRTEIPEAFRKALGEGDL